MNVTAAIGLESDGIDALKGILIALIVAGHNPLITGAFPGLFEALYSFHVVAFLLLPFWFPVPPLSGRLVKDRAVRYLVPHYVFYLLACVFFALTLADDSWGQRLFAVGMGALVGSADTVKAGSGLSLFWFLPALLTLTLLRSWHARAGGGVSVLILAIAAHLGIGLLPEAVRVLTPFGLLIALFVFPLGQFIVWAWPKYVAPWLLRWGLIAGITWIATLVYIFWARSAFNVGELTLYSVLHPLHLFLHDASALAAFVALTALCATPIGRLPFLAAMGRASLLIYLIHSFVFQALLLVTPRLGVPLNLVIGLMLFALTLVLSYGVAHLLMKSRVFQRWVTPRYATEWPPTAQVAQPLQNA